MANIVKAIGASHTTLMNTQWDKVDHLPRAHEFRDALGVASNLLSESKPDAVIIIGSNHFRGYWLDLMPAFSIGVGDIISSGEHGTPEGKQLDCCDVAIDLCNQLVDKGFDMTFSTRMTVDHGISHAIQWLVDKDTPIIPLVVNCFAPPLPTILRCLQLGDAIRESIKTLPQDLNLGVIATGGLSHQLPFPDWRKPESDDDEFLVDSWMHGRNNWSQYERRRREIIIKAPSQINEAFDRDLLQALCDGQVEAFISQFDERQIVEQAGNGGNEIRCWLMMAAIMAHQPATLHCYSPMPEWLTGMAVLSF